MEFHSSTKKKESMKFAGKSQELEGIVLIEITLAQKDRYCMFSLRWGS